MHTRIFLVCVLALIEWFGFVLQVEIAFDSFAALRGRWIKCKRRSVQEIVRMNLLPPFPISMFGGEKMPWLFALFLPPSVY
jgi:hypothetical protein